MAISFRFGTVGAPLSTPKKPGGSIGAVYQLAELNLKALELGWVQSVRVSEETCANIRKASTETDVSISVHAPYFINLNASPDEWPNSRKRLMDAAHYGNLAGATDIIFHPGSYFERTPGDVLKVAIPRLRECVDELRSSGNQVTLRPETMGKIAMLGSLEDTLAMAGEIPGVEPCLDFAHLHARAGDGSMNSTEEWLNVLESYQDALGVEALSRLHIHLSGIEYSNKGERNHLPIAASDFNLKDLFQALHEKGCAGRILCESPEMENDAAFMRANWLSWCGE
jgi:deoxyribonuclease IV